MLSQNVLTSVLPGSWLGILGGGQLGRMFTHAAQAMGYRVCVLDPDINSPTGAIADRHLCANYHDEAALDTLAKLCPCISTEFENVPAYSLAWLERQGQFVTPNHSCIALIQNRIAEKDFIRSCTPQTNIDTAPYLAIETTIDLDNIPAYLFPGILKTARLGYDGKGQINVTNHSELAAAWESLEHVQCILEQRLPLAYEISIILARGYDGQCVYYPAIENIHRHGILHTSTFPAIHINAVATQKIQQAAKIIAEEMNYVGVLCIEFFILKDGSIIANEIAPRPHNSGHITMDACTVSQFEQQVRIMARLPLGHIDTLGIGLMINLLGDLWFTKNSRITHEPAWEKIYAVPEAHLYLYGKNDARPGRKMGHLNLLAHSSEQISQVYPQICALLNIKP